MATVQVLDSSVLINAAFAFLHGSAVCVHFLKVYVTCSVLAYGLHFTFRVYVLALGFTSSDKQDVLIQAYHPCHVTISDSKVNLFF